MWRLRPQAVALCRRTGSIFEASYAPPPPEFSRPNEFDIGAFGTYATGVGSGEHAGRLHGWGGGMDFIYWFPWKYARVRFQGAGLSIGSGNGSQTRGGLTSCCDCPSTLEKIAFSATLVVGSNIGLLPISGSSAKLVMTSLTGPRTTSSRLISDSDTLSN